MADMIKRDHFWIYLILLIAVVAIALVITFNR